MPGKPVTVDAYLDGLPPDRRAALERLRRQVARAAPAATQAIWYGMPTFKLGGQPLVCFRAAPRHCALHVMSPKLVSAHEALLKGLDWSGGTVRFTPGTPLPAAVVEALVRARIAELGFAK